MPTPTLAYRLLSKVTRKAAPYIPLGVYRRLMPHNPLGFFYHSVSDDDLAHVKHLYPYKTPTGFEADIRSLKEHFTLVGYADLLAHFRGEKPLPPRAAFISFDDGFADCYSVVRPILLKHGVPCMFFLATDWVDNQRMYYRGKISLCMERLTHMDKPAQDAALAQIARFFQHEGDQPAQISIADLRLFQQWDEPVIDQICDMLKVNVTEYLRTCQPFLTRAQIREMRGEGFVFGAHTRSHPKLGLIYQNQQAIEIVESCRQVCEMTGEAQVPFAFPFSGNEVDRDFLADLRVQHPEIGLLFDTQKLRQDRPFIFHRIWVDKPVEGVAAERNLDYWLREAYVKEVNR